MRLVENWHRLHRAFSVQAMALAAAVQGAWPSIPADLKAALPPNLVHWVSITLLVAGIVGRMVDQGSITSQPPKDTP